MNLCEIDWSVNNYLQQGPTKSKLQTNPTRDKSVTFSPAIHARYILRMSKEILIEY